MQFETIHYSRDFKKLIENKKKIKLLIKGSHVDTSDFEIWKSIRFHISKIINRKGTILDIGCANGFLLRCLQEWSNHKLEPYGIDIDPKIIAQAKELFKSQAHHFIVKDLEDFSELKKHGFPEKYDFIYWNVWDNFRFENQGEVDLFKKVLKAVSDCGRLILGFYSSDNKIKGKIQNLKDMDLKFSNILENHSGCGEDSVIACIDKHHIRDK